MFNFAGDEMMEFHNHFRKGRGGMMGGAGESVGGLMNGGFAFVAMLVWVLFCGVAAAQVGNAGASGGAGGRVEMFGFDGVYRPECWTPMLVTIKPGELKSGRYFLDVIQEDLDRDRVSFRREISLTGGAGEQRYWVYFLPQVSRNETGSLGLPETNLKDVNRALKVILKDEDERQIMQLPITGMPKSVDGNSGDSWTKGTRIVLVVSESSRGAVQDYLPRMPPGKNVLAGLSENVIFVRLRPDQLPESVMGYDAADAVIWAEAEPPAARGGQAARRQALEEYVKRGGRLVISHEKLWQRLSAFEPMLPVSYLTEGQGNSAGGGRGVGGAVQLNDMKLLGELPQVGELWKGVRGDLSVGRVQANPEARVIAEFKPAETTAAAVTDGVSAEMVGMPMVVRAGWGAGSVTYVAFGLAEPVMRQTSSSAWPAVWELLLDWRNDPGTYEKKVTEDSNFFYKPDRIHDIGGALLPFIELSGKGAALIGLAVMFFIGYWVLACPVAYWILVVRKQTHLSWTVFGAMALLATLLTLGVVRVVLRGDAQISHVSVVRVLSPSLAGAASGAGVADVASVVSNVGVYVPRDGRQRIELEGGTGSGEESGGKGGGISEQLISNLPLHWAHVGDVNEYPAFSEYVVPVGQVEAGEKNVLEVPFRSTLKKFQVNWRGILDGDLTGGISGEVSVGQAEKASVLLSGKLTNNFKINLQQVYLVFSRQEAGREMPRDMVIYIPVFAAGETMQLERVTDVSRLGMMKRVSTDNNQLFGQPDNGPVYGVIGLPGAANDWDLYWRNRFVGTNNFGGIWNDEKDGRVKRSVPMLGLFSRISPMRLTADATRSDYLRRGARHLDISAAVSAGHLVILASSDGAKLPVPMTVNGNEPQGTGRILWQFVMPLDRKLEKAQLEELKAEAEKEKLPTKP